MDRTVTAKGILAAVASAVAVARHDVATVLAGRAVPAAELDMGAAGVVGLQDLAHERKKVEQSSLGQGPANRSRALPLAEQTISNMGVSDVFVVIRRMGRFGDHLVGPALAAD